MKERKRKETKQNKMEQNKNKNKNKNGKKRKEKKRKEKERKLSGMIKCKQVASARSKYVIFSCYLILNTFMVVCMDSYSGFHLSQLIFSRKFRRETILLNLLLWM